MRNLNEATGGKPLISLAMRWMRSWPRWV